MITTVGYYILFLFNVVLTAFLSLIIYYLNNKDSSGGSLSFFSTLSIIIVSLVTVSSNYSSLADEPNIILPVMIISIFLFLGLFVHKKIESNQDLISYMLFTFMPILIGMGFYVSTVSTIVVIFSMQYFFNGVFKFFTNHNDDLLGSDNGVEGNVRMDETTDIDDEIDSLNILDKN